MSNKTVTGTIRRPFVGQLVDIHSPEDADAIFTIKRCSVRENQARKNLASTIRYIEQADGRPYVQEKDIPVGDVEIETVMLGLHSWNLFDDNQQPLPLTHDNVLKYLSPAEFGLLYAEILKLNPMWTGQGEEEVKNS